MAKGFHLVADIGGTNARFGLVPVAAAAAAVEQQHSLGNDNFASAREAVMAYLQMVGQPPLVAACLAVAGPVQDGRVAMTNRAWQLSEAELVADLGVQQAVLLNDFEALAWCLPWLPDDGRLELLPGAAVPDAATVVLGPGTGMGVAALLAPGADGRAARVVSSEAGHVGFAPPSAAFLPVLAKVWQGRDRLMTEQLLSGPGLVRLYEAVRPIGAPDLDPGRISAQARSGSCAACVQAVALFLQGLAAFARDMALAFNAAGGVWLTGGVFDHLHDLLPPGLLEQTFRPQPERLLQQVPVFKVHTANAALIGAAARLRAGPA